MTNTCVCGCGRTLTDGYAHTDCTERARRQLAEIAELTEPARDVMYRQTSTSGSHSPPGPRDLLDYGAGARLDAVQTALTGWARAVAEERGAAVWVAMNGDIIGQAAQWLAGHLEWLRHKEFVDDVLREIGDCVHAMRGIVATPAGRVYLGPCGAEIELCGAGKADDVGIWWYCELRHHHKSDHSFEGHGLDHFRTCKGDVYGRPAAATGRCRECGADYDQAERLRAVTAMVEGRGYRASVIAHAYGLSANTIRGWAWVKRDREGNPLNDPKLKPVDHDHLKRPLYLVRDVLALHEQAEQRRQQRAAQAAEMGA